MLYCGSIGVLGETNTGKSTLINVLINNKLNITSRKTQTTKNINTSIYNTIDTQYIFMDTPGYLLINKFINSSISNIIFNNCDIILLLITISKKYFNLNFKDFILKNIPIILLINKTDILKKRSFLIKIIENFKNLNIFNEIIPISCYSKYNINKLKKILKLYLPKNKFLYKENFFLKKNFNFICLEFLREKLLRFTNQEIPYRTKLFMENIICNFFYKKLYFKIVVNKISQKLIILGNKGQKIKKIIKEVECDIKKISNNNKIYVNIIIVVEK